MGILLKGGANIDVQDTYGRTALMKAVNAKSKKAIKFLIENGADERIYDDMRENVFSIAEKEEREILDSAIKERNEKGIRRKCEVRKEVSKRTGADFY